MASTGHLDTAVNKTGKSKALALKVYILAVTKDNKQVNY